MVPSEDPASGHHGFVRWGHDAKITKIGVIPTRGSPDQGKANGSQDRRQDLEPISECTTWLLVSIEIWGRQLTTQGGEIGVPKGGHFGCSKLAKIQVTSNGISPRRLGDQICHSICNSPEVQLRLPCPWLLEISMPLGVVTIQTGSTIAKMAKLSTLTLG